MLIIFQIRGKILDPTSRSVKLSNLYPGAHYLVCVIALGNWASSRRKDTQFFSTVAEDTEDFEILNESVLPHLSDSSTSKCEEISTLGTAEVTHIGSISDQNYGTQSILTRRLGLIIGCCMGFVVFIVLVSVLGYLKVKKQRAAVKRDMPMPPEYISYRHFSIQSGETTGARGAHPEFITSMNTTSLNQ